MFNVRKTALLLLANSMAILGFAQYPQVPDSIQAATEIMMKAAYAHAIEAGYRFYSYGDASLLEKAQ